MTVGRESQGWSSRLRDDDAPSDEARLARERVRAGLFAEPPPQIGRYPISGVLGRGGMGVVYEAYDPELERPVALKVLHVGHRDGAQPDTMRLEREGQVLAQIDHPNVVRVFDVGRVRDETTDDTIDPRAVFIAMELVRGRSLRDLVVGGPLRWDDARALVLSMGLGLAAAHEHGIVHRDFKPENVLVGDDGRVRVVDFGLSRPAEDADPEHVASWWSGSQTRSGLVAGTPGYIAPEILEGAAHDARADQFAFFVTVYELLVGRRPFRADSLARWLEAAKGGHMVAPVRSAVRPRSLAKAIERGLSPDPGQRFASMAEALAALHEPRRGWVAVGLAAGSLAVIVAGASMPGARQECEPPDRWGEGPRAELSQVADPVLVGKLDAWHERWRDAYRWSCTSQAATALACLQRAHATFDAVTKRVRRSDGRAPIEDVRAVAALPNVERCTAPQSTPAVPVPEEPDRRARAAAVRAELAEIVLYRRLGEYETADELATEVVASAQALDDPYVTLEVELENGAGPVRTA